MVAGWVLCQRVRLCTKVGAGMCKPMHSPYGHVLVVVNMSLGPSDYHDYLEVIGEPHAGAAGEK